MFAFCCGKDEFAHELWEHPFVSLIILAGQAD